MAFLLYSYWNMLCFTLRCEMWSLIDLLLIGKQERWKDIDEIAQLCPLLDGDTVGPEVPKLLHWGTAYHTMADSRRKGCYFQSEECVLELFWKEDLMQTHRITTMTRPFERLRITIHLRVMCFRTSKGLILRPVAIHLGF